MTKNMCTYGKRVWEEFTTPKLSERVDVGFVLGKKKRKFIVELG